MKACVLALLFVATLSVSSFAQQDKSQRASPPDSVKVTTNDGVTIEIHYSKPSLNGRQLGSEKFVPLGKRWRTGANETTTFEVDKDVLIQGQSLPAGKYGLNSIPGQENMTLIFNKKWDQWGTQYDESEDILQVTATPTSSNDSKEQFTITTDKAGVVTLLWGNWSVPFTVKAAN
ncbi:DUF2911 domain-containing protein [Parapedobacter koreensis]|uniref:DUF2911 domain-containing protein n=1 Tax=Parapedobacter koreensis TaxID=332977 RepID=A0A1H7RNT1_9SPHI|nr:DUF2911 domain-containing protein [Parapedobacter koreensis]SEL61906.1 Protein of unknown function [Parapedobacter koreensis]